MRSVLLLVGILAYGCSDSSVTPTKTDDAGSGDAGSADAHTDMKTAGCLAGETICGESCVLQDDCSHAVVPEPKESEYIWVNGGTYLKLALESAGDVQGVRIGDAVVAFRAADAKHLWVEVPPGQDGPADVMLATQSGDVTTKRALIYRTGGEGIEWTKKTMTAARGGYPAMATTFDGHILVAAGYTDPASLEHCSDTGDLFDRQSGESTPADNTMSTKRWTATATTLLNGKTVIAGACYGLGSCPFDSTLIDLYDPETNSFSPSKAKFSSGRSFLRNLLLADGRVLFASIEEPHFEIYDPEQDAMTPVTGGTYSKYGVVLGWMARLRDGKVLIVPGGGDPNSIFDPASGSFTPTGDSLAHFPDALIAIGDGRVFAIGGATVETKNGELHMTTTKAIAVFDPLQNRFSPWSKELITDRFAGTAVLARNGLIYVLGGISGTGKLHSSCSSATDFASFTILDSVELIDPAAGTVTAGPTLPEPNLTLRSSVFFDGSIVAGGGTICGSSDVSSFASVYFLEAPPID